jgi:cell division protein FtsB
MPEETVQSQTGAAGSRAESASRAAPRRALDWMQRVWRPSVSVVAVALAFLLGWHVFNGKHGLTVWQQKRAEDRELRKEIDTLERDNARMREHVERLKSDPGAIGHEAREKLHYAKPNEVIVSLPPEPQTQAQPAGAGK